MKNDGVRKHFKMNQLESVDEICLSNSYSMVFLTYETECSIFSSAGKFCLAHELTQLTRDTKLVSVDYKRSLRAITKNAE